MAEEEEAADKISNLPADILYHIAKFLDVNSLLKISLLSKKLQFLRTGHYLWTRFPCLNFPLPRFQSSVCYLDFQLPILFERSGVLHRDTISFSCETHHCFITGCVRKHIQAAIERRVEELHLSLRLWNPRIPPLSLDVFSGNSLRVLKFDSNQTIGLPSLMTIDLPNLQYLHLEGVHLKLGSGFVDFLPNFPLLKTLVLKRCDILNPYDYNRLDISSTSLTSLVVENNGSSFCTIAISTPNLLFFEFWDDPEMYKFEKDLIAPTKIQFETLKQIVDFSAFRQEIYIRGVINCIRSGINVPDLTLGYHAIQIIWDAARPEAIKESPISLCNVTSLKLKYLVYKDWLVFKNCIHAIVYMLHIAPNIQTLVLKADPHPVINGSNEIKVALWRKDDFVEAVVGAKMLELTSKLDHLKKVEMRNFFGREEEFRILSLLLKTANALDTIVLAVPQKYSLQHENMKTTISQILQKLPRASPSISISFSGNECVPV